MADKLPQHTLYASNLPLVAGMTFRYGVSRRQLPRTLGLFSSSILSAPLRWWDTARSARRVARVQLDQPPVFIIGQPRSGTTHLHNLLCRDPQFGSVTMFHCGAADTFLGAGGLMRRVMGSMLPDSRPMDNVRIGLDEPQEEEMGLARFSPLSYNHCLHFPRQTREIFDRCVLFRDAPQAEARWKRDYSWFLRRVSLEQGGRPLCLKSPPNLARVRPLLELFPNARFIHIYRNPYVVYRSSLNLWKKVLPLVALQEYDWDQVVQNVLYIYQAMYERYFEDVPRIPSGQLTEVRFEDLEAHPLEELARIYSQLELPGFELAKEVQTRYLDSLDDYRKNTYSFEPEVIEQVEKHWSFAVDRWGYEHPTHG